MGVCLQEQVWGSGQWLSALKNSHQLSPVPTCSHHHQMHYFGIESDSGGTICPKGVRGAISLWLVVVALGMTTGRGSWQSLGGNSVGRRVSVLAWKCACSEMSSNPAGSEPGGQVALSMVVLHGANLAGGFGHYGQKHWQEKCPADGNEQVKTQEMPLRVCSTKWLLMLTHVSSRSCARASAGPLPTASLTSCPHLIPLFSEHISSGIILAICLHPLIALFLILYSPNFSYFPIISLCSALRSVGLVTMSDHRCC